MEICIDEITEIDNHNSIFEKDFNFQKTIANGSFGIVKSAINKLTGDNVAVKIIEKNQTTLQALTKTKQEVQILKTLSHPNIIRFITSIETTTKLYIVTELLKGGTLKNYLDTSSVVDEEKSAKIIYFLLQAVNYIHMNDIVHRDIKPENIMFADKSDLSSLKLVDFGLSAVASETSSTFCGTLLYMAPELFDATMQSNPKTVDIWSIGIITSMLLCGGKHPYFEPGESKRKYIAKLKKGYVMNKNLSEMSNNFISKLLEPNPHRRYTAKNALNHPWITRSVLGEIPLTLYEKLFKKVVAEKVKDALIAVVFINRIRDKNEKKFNIDKKYLEQIENVQKQQKEMFEIKRKSSFLRVKEINSNSETSLKTKKAKEPEIQEKKGPVITFECLDSNIKGKINSENNLNEKIIVKKKRHKLLMLKPISDNNISKINKNKKHEISSYRNNNHFLSSLNKNMQILKNSDLSPKFKSINTNSSQQSTKSHISPIKCPSKFNPSQAYSQSPKKTRSQITNIESSSSTDILSKKTNHQNSNSQKLSKFPIIEQSSSRCYSKFKLQIMDFKIQSVILPKISSGLQSIRGGSTKVIKYKL